MASTTTSTTTSQRAAVSNLAVRLGNSVIMVDAVPSAVPNKDKDSEFHSACTVCTTPTRLRQTLYCPVDGGHVQDAVNKRKVKELPDKSLVFVTPEEIAAVRGTDDNDETDGPKVLDLVPVRQAELMEHTLPGDVVYRLRPNKKTSASGTYDVLRLLVTQALRSGKVLIGEFPVRSTNKLYWLSIRHNQVIAQALMRPDDIASFDTIPAVDLGEKAPELAKQLIDTLTVEFNPATYRNRVRERAAALAAAKAENGDTATVIPITTSKKNEVDLDQLLGSMLAS